MNVLIVCGFSEPLLKLANALENKGANIYFLMHADHARAPFLKNGFYAFHWDDVNNKRIGRAVRSWWEEVKKEDISKISYKNINLWEITEFERLILKSGYKNPFAASHLLRRLSVILGKKESMTEEILLKNTAAYVEFFSQLLSRIKFDVIFVWNGQRNPIKVLSEVGKSRGIKIYYCERGYVPDTMNIDKQGVNYASYLCGKEWDEIKDRDIPQEEIEITKRFMEEYQQKGKSIVEKSGFLSQKEVLKRLGLSEDKKIIFFPAQIEIDANIVLFSPYYRDILTVIKDILAEIKKHPDYHLVIKMHPEDKDRLNEFRNIITSQATIVSKMNLHSLIRASTFVTTINSTVGLESLAYYKPVLVLGNAFYSKKGLTYDISGRSELGAKIEEIIKGPSLDADKKYHINRFFHYLLKNYAYFLDNNEVFKGSNSVLENTFISNNKEISTGVFLKEQRMKRMKTIKWKSELYLCQSKASIINRDWINIFKFLIKSFILNPFNYRTWLFLGTFFTKGLRKIFKKIKGG